MAVRRVKRTPDVKVEVEYVPIDDLVPWEDNPRSNDEAAVRLAKLMDEHGFVNPVVAWGNVVYAGCTRLKAARLRGIERVPVIQGDFRDERQAVAFALADNRSAEWATWDEDALARLLNEDLAEVDVEALEAMTGFEQAEIEGLRSGIQEPEPLPESTETNAASVLRQCPNCGHEWTE
jgi:ParB-like chromosome segregation protein Spo0J